MNVEVAGHRSGKHSRGDTGQGFLSAYWSTISFPSFPILTTVPSGSLFQTTNCQSVHRTEQSKPFLILLYKQIKMVLKMVVVTGSRLPMPQVQRLMLRAWPTYAPLLVSFNCCLIQPRIPWGLRLTRSGWPWSRLWEVVLTVTGGRAILAVGGSMAWTGPWTGVEA